jgi:hypothetical protein
LASRSRIIEGKQQRSILDILTAGWVPENATTEGDVDRMEVPSSELRNFGEDVEAGQV